jgi:TRAP-type mannitol/chloroaromatic compound transport system permease small subunit
MRALVMLDRLIDRIVDICMWLALPLVLLLFLQWPLRDIFHAYSREANDLGQIIFAIYVAASVTAATRAGTHLAADAVAQRYSPRLRRRIKQLGALVGLVPWALFVTFAGTSMLVPSLLQREAFPDTYNPGYFILKLALWLMTILLLAQALIDIVRPPDRGDA